MVNCLTNPIYLKPIKMSFLIFKLNKLYTKEMDKLHEIRYDIIIE